MIRTVLPSKAQVPSRWMISAIRRFSQRGVSRQRERRKGADGERSKEADGERRKGAQQRRSRRRKTRPEATGRTWLSRPPRFPSRDSVLGAAALVNPAPRPSPGADRTCRTGAVFRTAQCALIAR
ncbi:hypothetical protein GCM10023083_05530 [Streptomyces phyllanthi]